MPLKDERRAYHAWNLVSSLFRKQSLKLKQMRKLVKRKRGYREETWEMII